ncbi:MAG: SusC/RagA family TonB-linked outer membrane protein, partial [Bacteroidota bacterium]
MRIALRVSSLNGLIRGFTSLLMILLCYGSLLSQRTITGTIENENGESLIGASVQAKGTFTGTVTDIDGNYSIQVEESTSILVFSYTGYETQEIEIGASNTMDVTMKEGVSLSEVVVIGYSPVAREKVLGAVSSVGSEDIVQVTPVSAFDAVQGRLAGVQIQTNGGPGAGFDIKIRGVSTFSSGTEPLYVVDGQQLENIDNIDPNDIESLEVLKDGATAAIYGSRGANGVVIITTKSGASNDVKVDITANTSWTELFGALPLSNTAQRIEYEDVRRGGATSLTGTQRDSLSLLNRNSHDLQALLTRTAIRHQVNVALSGGNEKAQVYWNTGFQDQEGVIVNSSYQRINSRLKLNFQPVERLSLGTNLNVSYEDRFGLNEGQVFQQMVERIAYFPVFEPNGTFTPEIAGRQNPLAEANLRTLRQRNFRSQIFSFAQFRILPSLSIKSTVGINFRYRLDNDFEPVLTQNPRSPIPRGAERRTLAYDLQQENFLNYIEDFGRHSVSAFVGMQTQQYVNEGFNLQAQFVSDNIQTFNNIDPLTLSVSNGTINERHDIVSLFAGFNYDFDNKYLLGATVRRDGSSRFGADNKYGLFPSFTLGWRLSNESFIEEGIPAISNLLVRF